MYYRTDILYDVTVKLRIWTPYSPSNGAGYEAFYHLRVSVCSNTLSHASSDFPLYVYTLNSHSGMKTVADCKTFFN